MTHGLRTTLSLAHRRSELTEQTYSLVRYIKMSYTQWIAKQSILKHCLFNMVNYCEMQTVSGSCVLQNPCFKLQFPWQQHILINNIFLPCFVF